MPSFDRNQTLELWHKIWKKELVQDMKNSGDKYTLVITIGRYQMAITEWRSSIVRDKQEDEI